jgi:hypothetical protein
MKRSDFTVAYRPQDCLPTHRGMNFRFMPLFALLFFLAACTPTPPIAKIGLIAPFEGLHRDSGYAALAALRAALQTCAPAGTALLPLALDDSADPASAARAAAKLRADPTVVAVVGPLFPATALAAQSPLAVDDRPWLLPFALSPDDDPLTDAWLRGQVDWLTAQRPGARIVVVGLPAAWPFTPPPPTLRVDDPNQALTALAPDDQALWLGMPETLAAWLPRLRAQHPTLPVWYGLPLGADILAAQLPATPNLHWLVWNDPAYNPQLLDSLPPTPIAVQTYWAACRAVAESVAPTLRPQSPTWSLTAQPLPR